MWPASYGVLFPRFGRLYVISKGWEPRTRRQRVTSLNNTAERTSYLANENLLPEMLTVGGKGLHRRVCSFLTQSLHYVCFIYQMNSNASHNSNDPVWHLLTSVPWFTTEVRADADRSLSQHGWEQQHKGVAAVEIALGSTLKLSVSPRPEFASFTCTLF